MHWSYLTAKCSCHWETTDRRVAVKINLHQAFAMMCDIFFIKSVQSYFVENVIRSYNCYLLICKTIQLPFSAESFYNRNWTEFFLEKKGVVVQIYFKWNFKDVAASAKVHSVHIIFLFYFIFFYFLWFSLIFFDIQ